MKKTALLSLFLIFSVSFLFSQAITTQSGIPVTTNSRHFDKWLRSSF